MNKQQIEPAVRERIRALCKQVTVAYDLDAEIQEELYGHMEDKLLAYLAGEEKLSSEDAFILVREHFGNPEALKEILQAVHESTESDTTVPVSLPRRLAAALVAMAIVDVPARLVCYAAQFALGMCIVGLETIYGHFRFIHTGIWVYQMPLLTSSVLFCWLLVRWQRRLMKGQTLWFVRWPAYWMWASVGAALVVPLFVPVVVIAMFSTPTWYQNLVGPMASIAIWQVLRSISAVAWLWWADRPPRAANGMKWAFLGLVLLTALQSLHPRLAPLVEIGFSTFAGLSRGYIPTGEIFGTGVQWSVFWPLIWPIESIHSRATSFDIFYWNRYATIVVLPLLAYGIYRLLTIIQRWSARRNTRGRATA